MDFDLIFSHLFLYNVCKVVRLVNETINKNAGQIMSSHCL